MIYSKKQIKDIKFVRDELLRVSLWGTLYISKHMDPIALKEAVALINKNKIFAKYGFNVELIDGEDFIQKVPYFWDNEKFIEENNLTLGNRPNYKIYLDFMDRQRKFYNK